MFRSKSDSTTISQPISWPTPRWLFLQPHSNLTSVITPRFTPMSAESRRCCRRCTPWSPTTGWWSRRGRTGSLSRGWTSTGPQRQTLSPSGWSFLTVFWVVTCIWLRVPKVRMVKKFHWNVIPVLRNLTIDTLTEAPSVSQRPPQKPPSSVFNQCVNR